jgi:hypothetical protein
VRDLTAHLAMTFRRFADMLEQSRRGDLTPPFAAADLITENLQAVERFQGDPLVELERQAHRFLALISNPNECMAHQRGPIPVSLQLLFALNELAIHRDDLEVARGSRYRPADEVIEALIPIQEQLLGGLPSCGDPWQSILVRSGRPVAK